MIFGKKIFWVLAKIIVNKEFVTKYVLQNAKNSMQEKSLGYIYICFRLWNIYFEWMQWWGWSCAQNKCGSCKLPIGRAFVMNGGDGHTKINLF